LRREARALRIRQLGQGPLQPRDVLLGDHQRQEVRVREVAVVLRIFLAAHGAGLVALGIVEAGFLLDAAAVFQDLDLAARLELDRPLHEAEGIEVLDLAARAQRALSGLAHGDIGVAAERSFLHVAVADADPHHQRVERAGVGHRLPRAAQLGLRDDLEQRRACAVQVDARHALKILMQGFPRVFLEVRSRQPHHLFFPVHEEADLAALHDGQLVLADLVALRQVGIEVVLAREDGAAIDASLHGEAETDGVLHCGAVHYRQRSGQGKIHCRSVRVGRGAKIGGRPGEDLAARGKLRVRLDADDDLPGHG
jgi:hypothetical protein